jgi:sugar lactone lactonase YvrE
MVRRNCRPKTAAGAVGGGLLPGGAGRHAAGKVFFSDIAGNRILKMDPNGAVAIIRADTGRTNGNCFDAEGRLASCEGGE